MVLTPSRQVPLGFKAPDFSLRDVKSGKEMGLDDLCKPRGLLVMFICNHCPYVKFVQDKLVKLGRDYEDREVGFVAISSNDVENYPEDAPDRMKQVAQSLGYPFPYLYDETQKVARAYQAVCTPDFFLFNGNRELVYRGQLDGARPGNGVPVTGADVRAALDALLTGGAIDPDQKPSVGCNIKWKVGT